jgi:hypothetical protein
MKVQYQYGNGFDITPYFDKISGKTITLKQFEGFLSSSILEESNRSFNIEPNPEKLKELLENFETIRIILNSLRSNLKCILKIFFDIRNYYKIYKISKILRSYPEHLRILILIPQFFLTNNFTSKLLKTKGDFSNLEIHDFLGETHPFLMVEKSHQLIFINMHKDIKNNVNNTAFGPRGLQCPGALISVKYISSILRNFKRFDIKIKNFCETTKENEKIDIYNGTLDKDRILLSFIEK